MFERSNATKHVILLLALLSFTLIIIGRHHLEELSEVVRTYALFRQYLSQHPESLYRYSYRDRPATPSKNGQDKTPAIFHQIYLQEGKQNPFSKWEYKLWTDGNASDFITDYYPELSPHYRGYKQTVQRANLLRYTLLDHFGGIYLDLDVACLHDLDDLRHLPWLTPAAYPAGLNNAFILSRPHHPFLKYLLAEVKRSDRFWYFPYVETMLSTGCMFLSTRWMRYAEAMSSLEIRISQDAVYVLADEAGETGPHMLRGATSTPLLRHGGASSWHDWDAAAIILVGQHYLCFLSIVAFGVACAIGMAWRFSKLRNTRRYGWGRRRPWWETICKNSGEEARSD